MAPISLPSFAPADLAITGATNSKITNLSIPTANTEVAHILQADLKQLIIKCRDSADVKCSFVLGESGSKYVTIFRGCVFHLSDLTFNSTVYLQSTKGSLTVEILELF